MQKWLRGTSCVIRNQVRSECWPEGRWAEASLFSASGHEREDFLLPNTNTERQLHRLVCRRLRLRRICACSMPRPLPLGDDSPAGPEGLKPETGRVCSKQQLLYEAEAAAGRMWRSDGETKIFLLTLGGRISPGVPARGGFSVVCGGRTKTASSQIPHWAFWWFAQSVQRLLFYKTGLWKNKVVLIELQLVKYPWLIIFYFLVNLQVEKMQISVSSKSGLKSVNAILLKMSISEEFRFPEYCYITLGV